MTDPTVRQAVTELFTGQGWPEDGDELLRRSLGPRPPELLLDAPGWLGLGAGELVLDAGCRDATYALALARRYRCRVLGVDLVAAGLPRAGTDAAAAGMAGRVAFVQGGLEALPVAGGACDLVWCRDTLSCLPDCATALAECARVLRPGGGMVLYAVMATDELAPADRERIGSEWSEHRLERDPGYLTQDLLEVARLTRDRDRMEAALGPVWYRRALGFALWGPQIVLGRLDPVLYALVKRA